MLEAEYLLFCESKAVDDRNRLSLINIFETIYASSFPAQHPQMRAVFKLRATKAIVDKKLKVKLSVSVGKEKVGKFEAELNVTVEKENSIVPDIDLAPAVFPKAGKYDIRLYVDDKELISRELRLRSSSELSEQ